MEVKLQSEYIKLGQLLKFVGLISTGGEEKPFLLTHHILVNGSDENRRGRKIYPGDVVVVDEDKFYIK